MGSWSVKCAITQLPITRRDDVVLLLGAAADPKQRGRDTGGFQLQGHFFNLIAPPIYGKYNDYGWVEHCDKTSLELAYQFIKLSYGANGDLRTDEEKGYDRDIINEPMIDIRSDVHWYDMFEQFRAWIHPRFDYTFVHRSVWDDIVTAGMNNLRRGLSISRTPAEYLPTVRAVMGRHGCISGEYDFFGFPGQHFAAGRELWESLSIRRPNFKGIDDIPQELIELFIESESLPPDKRKELTFNLTQAQHKEFGRMFVASIGVDDYFPVALASSILGFFEQRKKVNPYRAMIIADIKRIDAFLNLVTPTNEHIMLETQVVLNALVSSGIIVRGHEELATEEQCGGPCWVHAVVHKAERALLFKKAQYLNELFENDESPVSTEVDVALEQLIEYELNEGKFL